MLKIIISMMVITLFAFADLPLGKTGQTTEYMIGDDGTYTSGRIRNYSDNRDGTINDAMLHLIWQNDYSDNKGYASNGDVPDLNYSQAVNYCSDINLVGDTDWRLPTHRELQSLVDFSKPELGPVIANEFVSTTQTSDSYWTNTDSATYSTTHAWSVYFKNGIVSISTKSGLLHVRCVRESKIRLYQTNYTKMDGIVSDSKTGLMWQDDYDDNPSTTIDTVKDGNWTQAISYCNALSALEHDDWRLPNVNELLSITDDTDATPPAINGAFEHIKNDDYWTSTTKIKAGTTPAYTVLFSNGGVGAGHKVSAYYIRCVRGSVTPEKLIILTPIVMYLLN